MAKCKITMQPPLKGATLSFLTPYYQQGRGNATTARRIVTGLLLNQINAKVISLENEPYSPELFASSSIVHVLHFRRFAEWLGNHHLPEGYPFVITSGGTDVNIDIFKEQYSEKIGVVLQKAAAITVFSDDAKQKLQNVYPRLDNKIHIIKQSVWLPDSTRRTFRGTVKLPGVGPNIVLPAGLREVKDVLFVLPALVELKKRFSNLTFTIIGTPIEQSVLNEVQAQMRLYPWVKYYEEIPLEKMESIYRQSNIIINTSLSEGQSSALLEAMLLEKPVVARNNGGNRSIIKHGETGLLFDHLDEFYHQIERLLEDDWFKQRICMNAKNYVHKEHNLQKEVDGYIKLYEQILN